MRIVSAATVTGCDAVAVARSSSVTVRVTVKVPPAAYVCDGLTAVEVVPSPKLQAWVMVPSASVDVLVNVQANPLQDGVNDAVGGTFVGGAVTVTDCVSESVARSSSVTMRLTVYGPPAVYVCEGLTSVEVAPSPKLQAWVMVPSASVDVLVKAQVRPEHDALNDADGGWFGGGAAVQV